MKLFLAIGAGAGLAYLLATKQAGSGLQGLDSHQAGIMGSPFFVQCTFSQESFDSMMDLNWFRDKGEPEVRRMATKCMWGCVDDREVKAAQFRNRANPDEFAILAKSAKGDGKWQMNWFDARGPRGDSPRQTQCAGVKELSSGRHGQGYTMLVDDEVMSDWYLEAWA